MRNFLLLALMTIATVSAAAAGQVVLRNGKVLDDAVIQRLQPATYLVQTPKTLYELSEDELDPATLHSHDFSHQREFLATHHYDEIHADGTVTSYFSNPLRNNGKKAITESRWGLAPWERTHAERRAYVDDRGTPLVPRYNPPAQKWAAHPNRRVQVILPLAVPVAPGEMTTITGRETSTQIRKTDEGLIYSHPGDFAEDRLIWRKVRLPRGARIVRVSPQPSARFSQEGHEYLMWRRFYQKGEVYPLEVVYTLE